jgi:nucleotide-binding universal stress UspA family protein
MALAVSVAGPEATMNVRPSVLCPVDYSPASASALCYAAALAEHFVTRLIVMTVRDAAPWDADIESAALFPEEPALASFVRATFGPNSSIEALCEYEIALGTPAAEIARVARERSCDLIVMAQPNAGEPCTDQSGATIEELLVGATIPVLLTPPSASAPAHVEDLRHVVRRVVMAADPTADLHRQRDVAMGLAEALDVDLVFDAVPTPAATTRAPHGGDTNTTDLMVVSLNGRRDQALHSWTAIRAFKAPALILVLPPPSIRSDRIHAAIRQTAEASSTAGHRRSA